MTPGFGETGNVEFAPASIEFEKPGEECGVFGIYAPGENLAALTYLGLMNLQHRGQQGCGISVSDGELILAATKQGLVKNVFAPPYGLAGLGSEGVVSTGHTRYGTSGTPKGLINYSLQPFVFLTEGRFVDTDFTLSHNGHLENISDLAESMGIDTKDSASDSQILNNVIGNHVEENGDIVNTLATILPKVQGAFSLAVSTKDKLIAVRDPQGFRPLHLGRYNGTGWVVASELAAFSIIGADPVREIEPGELVIISDKDESGVESMKITDKNTAVCSFEYVYFSRGSNELLGESVQIARNRMGEILARKDSVSADFVVGVPNSGIHAADGYAWGRDLRHEKCLEKNDYTDRTFIAPTQNERSQGVHNKLLVMPHMIKDKKVVVVDDSIVRGTTTKTLVKMMRDAGASEVHVRVASPPYKWPCYFGMDTGRRDELIASRLSIDEIRDFIDADTLDYLTPDELLESIGTAAGKVCTACTTGIYPVPVDLSKKP